MKTSRRSYALYNPVTAGLVPAIHDFLTREDKQDVDARNKCGHDATISGLVH